MFVYTAPVDGWMKVSGEVNNDSAHELTMWTTSDISHKISWTTNGYTEFSLPLAKGHDCTVSLINISKLSFKFIYSQSEV